MPYNSTITFTLDTICPWTYLAFTRLQTVLSNFHTSNSSQVQFTLRLAPYQLYPDFGTSGEPKYEWYKHEKYNDSDERMQMYVSYMKELGKEDGIEFDFENGMIANTFSAHRILHYLQEDHSPAHACTALESLYLQYFTQGKHPSGAETLTSACIAAGLDEVAAKALVEDEDTRAIETKAAIREQVGNAVDSVPFVVFEGRKRDFTLIGAKCVKDYEKVLAQVVKEAT